MSIKKILLAAGFMILLAVILASCGGKPEPTAVPTEPPELIDEKPVVEVPYLALWEGSAHNAVDTEAFRHWDSDDPAEVPATCAKCHSTAGYRDFLGADGSEPNKVDAAVAARDSQGIQCVACHNPVTTFEMTSVAFPGFETNEAGDPVPYVVEGLGDAARCMVCHQGRESKASVDAQIARFSITDVDAVVAPIQDEQGIDVRFGFRNIHYYAAAATLYGTEVKGGYEYEGKTYDARFRHVEGIDTCIGCHDPHTLKVKVDTCAQCHDGVSTVEDLKNVRMVSSASDYDGDGDVTEGVAHEIEGLEELLLAEIQKYAEANGGAISYDAAAYPYWFGADGSGYAAWTARLLKATYNYQVAKKDPGQFAHGGKYIIELLYDSIEDLGGDVNGLARSDAGHFAGNTEAFRHWDEDGEVPGSCARCHTATGLPQYLKEGATISNEIANGFMCTTCHNEESWPERYSVASVAFPSGATVSFGGKDADGSFVADDGNLCLQCHQGRSSKPTLDKALTGKDVDTLDAQIRFSNIHYFAAGATLFGADVQGAYMYDGREYAGYFEAHPLNKCQDCHDVHALQPKVEACANCHGAGEVAEIRLGAPDYDGDGNVTEGVKSELDTLAEALYAEIQTYAEGTGNPIQYNAQAYPYFFAADGSGYAAWTPRLLKAAYNYQYYQKDPGAFVHNGRFVAQFLIDSIADLGGDVSQYIRPEVPAPE